MRKIRRVALLIETSRAYGRGLLRGIAKYVETHGSWLLDHRERALRDAAPPGLTHGNCDGIIARIENRRLIRQIEQLDVPAVDLRGMYKIDGVPVITPNQQAVVRLAADELMERGFRHFGYCGISGLNYCAERAAHFREYLADAGFTASVFGESRSLQLRMSSTAEARIHQQKHALVEWIKSLPKPLGLMACNDLLAQQVIEVCREHDILMPDSVSVLGVDNDDTVCRLCNPPLSSVELNAPQAGYEAAALLDRMMDGQPPPSERILVEPLDVVTRRSTDVMVLPDKDVVAALRFIREHACDGIRVEDVLEIVQLSRSTLERRFAQFLGRAPRAEIIRVQVQRVKELLAQTNLPLERVAQLAGYNHVESMSNLFKQKIGQTPGQYRESARSQRQF